MFKELGALIAAAGEVAAKSLRISANAVKEALSDKDGEGDHLMGCLVDNSDRFRELDSVKKIEIVKKIDLGETIYLKEYKSKDGSIIVNANEVDEDK